MSERGVSAPTPRTHRRWVAAVLALYGVLVSIGIIATAVHRAIVSQSTWSAVAVSFGEAAK